MLSLSREGVAGGAAGVRKKYDVSVKRSYGRVTGVGHTSLSSASIRSGEIIVPVFSYFQGGYMTIVKVPPQIADLRREVLAATTVVSCPVFAPVKSILVSYQQHRKVSPISRR